MVYKRGRPVLLEGDARRKKEMPVLEVHPRKEKGSCYECPYGNKKPVVFVTLLFLGMRGTTLLCTAHWQEKKRRLPDCVSLKEGDAV